MNSLEVIYYSRIGKHFPPCDISDILQAEQYIARAKIGKEFYQALIADLVDYTGVSQYVAGTTYNQGDNVAYRGIIYTVTAVTSNKIPTVTTDWTQAPKFGTACFENLWCNYLARYIALCVIANTIPKIAAKITAEGIVVLEGDGYRAAGKERISDLKAWAAANIEMTWANMVDYIDCNNECYGLFRKTNACGCKARYNEKFDTGNPSGYSDPYLIC